MWERTLCTVSFSVFVVTLDRKGYCGLDYTTVAYQHFVREAFVNCIELIQL